jgi:hypothetical protein
VEQVAHTVLVVAAQAAVWYWPAPQVAQAAQVVLAVPAQATV